MTLATDIQKLVELEQIKAQLNPDILQRVLDLQKSATALDADLAQHKRWLESEREVTKQQRGQIEAANARLAEIAKREEACAAREKDHTRLQLMAEHEARRVDDHKEMFRLVFRNIETRRDVFTPLPGLPGRNDNGYQTYPTPPQVQQNEQRTSAE